MPYENNFIDHRIGRKTVILEKDLEVQEKIESQMLRSNLKYLSDKERQEQKFHQEIKKLQEIGADTSEAMARYRASVEERKKAEEELASAKIRIQDDLNKKVSIATKNAYNQMSIRERREYSKNVAEKLQQELDSWEIIEKRHQDHIEKLKADAATKTGDEKTRADAEIAKEEAAFANKRDTLLQQKKLADEMSKGFLQASLGKGLNAVKDKTGVDLSAEGRYKASEDANKEAEPFIDHYKEEFELKKQIIAAQLKGDKARVTALKNQQAEQKRLFEESGEQEQAKAAIGEAALKSLAAAGAATIDGLARGADNLFSDFKQNMTDSKRIDSALNEIFDDQSKYLAKLKDSNEDWRKSVDNVSDAIGFSGVVRKTSVITKMKELVDSGIAYNIELRAFLAETSANIASTFEVTNGTLLRMIRLQQQDSTAARLGMEATLTRLFNKFFEDTTYLNDVADDISASILDASATMTRDMSLEFEYNVQKWLGSLYSLGISSSAVQKIAEGVNYLGTGNAAQLSGNSSLQTLLAMSSSKAGGKSYAQMLTEGITAEDTNALLKSMIEYLAEIANSQTNMVTKSAYADLFGISVTDLSTFASLTTSEIESLYKQTVSYDSLLKETSTRLSDISDNMSITQLVNNAIDNATVGVATTIGSNAFTYGTWKALNLLKEYVGETPTPGIA